MDANIILLVAALAGLMLMVGLVVSLRRGARGRLDKRVEATITHIQVEASSLSSWWTITAEWTDPQTGRHYHFRSPHLRYSPTHRVGEQIAVTFDGTKPQYHHMEL